MKATTAAAGGILALVLATCCSAEDSGPSAATGDGSDAAAGARGGDSGAPASSQAGSAGTGRSGGPGSGGSSGTGAIDDGGAAARSTGGVAGSAGAVDGGALPGGALETRAITGRVTRAGSPVPGARVTVFVEDIDFFREVRTAADGTYSIDAPRYPAELGVSARSYAYEEVVLAADDDAARDVALGPEVHPGRWSAIGTTDPEYLEGTGWGTLLFSGDLFFCHNGDDPVVFNPRATSRWFPAPSGVRQGCHLEVPLMSGDVLIAGGSTEGLPQQNVVDVTKSFQLTTGSWPTLASLNEGRWYPGGVRLPDERVLLIGGEGAPDGYGRVDTCEIYDVDADEWTPTGSFDLPTEMPPSVVLETGEVLKTWRYPELYDIALGSWGPAAAMQQARVGAPGGDHADHEIVYLRDGRLMAVGIDPDPSVTSPSMVEFYDVASDAWAVGPTPEHLRRAPEAAQLPDGRVLVFGGTYTGSSPGDLVLKNAGEVQNCTNVADLFDPSDDSWRPAAPLGRWIHYHAVTLLAPDGRVISTGGAGTGTSILFGDDATIEAYEPPYLFRGVRPRIDDISKTDLTAGETFSMRVSRTNAVTEVVVLGARATTHWMDTGPNRFIAPPFTQDGDTVTVTLPTDGMKLVPGWYLVFAMVDDIPSEGVIVRVTASGSPDPIGSLPAISVETDRAVIAEGASATLTLRRAGGNIATALTVALDVGGTATEGLDFAPLPRVVTFPENETEITVPFDARPDPTAEGDESARIGVARRVHYEAVSPTSATVTIAGG